MAGLGIVAGCLAVMGGLGGALVWDLPSGPAIVVAAAILFLMALVVPLRHRMTT